MLLAIWRLLVNLKTNLSQIQRKLDLILELLQPGPAVKLLFIAELDGKITIGVTSMNLRDDQNLPVSIQPVDKKGNAAPVDGVPAWLSSNTELVTVTASDDGLSATVSPVGPLGMATISVTADADLGAGVTEIAGSLDVTVISGGAVTVNIVAGTPVDQG